jgi:cell-division ATP-binding protein
LSKHAQTAVYQTSNLLTPTPLSERRQQQKTSAIKQKIIMSLIDYKNIDIYQGEKLVLQDVNFHVDEGEFMYIIGSVGSGKSSLLKTFYCELDIWHEENKEEEKAEVLGRDIFNLKRKEVPALRREMGIIFQDFKLLHEMTVRKNLEFVLKSTGWKSQKDINERIESVLTDVGMLDKIDKLPHELSGGEQQRVAIARAILNKPKIIIADEPTGNLDPDTAGKIIGLLKDISTTGTAVVMTTHNIPMLDRFPGIVYRCKDGAINDVTTEYNKMDLSEDAQYDAQP